MSPVSISNGKNSKILLRCLTQGRGQKEDYTFKRNTPSDVDDDDNNNHWPKCCSRNYLHLVFHDKIETTIITFLLPVICSSVMSLSFSS